MTRSFLPSLWSEDGNGKTNPFERLHDEVDRLFESFGHGPLRSIARADNGSTLMSPRIDVKETDKEILISAELPGVDEKDVEVTFADNVLTIKGEKKTEKEEKDTNYHRVERSYGSFMRSISLPAAADEAKISATCKNGVLSVTVPKSAEAQAKAKRIEVKAA